jgi:hypothetical protein
LKSAGPGKWIFPGSFLTVISPRARKLAETGDLLAGVVEIELLDTDALGA